ncbi:hypothetical protein [Desulfovibrio ferrophilus]|uniref:Uncharacterized protein n=1 Tax=Desulfovibrio ferrophilus TaxID=241368 RepID=A0A2Z6B0D9_9BACT|nr:hypothetical protein [Desulfovibrio ferrophilus]BBD08918.1 putative uncharacterized protein [Desulfovibrio ferrophilus]
MSTIVRAMINAGLPNPVWELDDEQENMFLDILKKEKPVSGQSYPRGHAYLGYGGLLVSTEPDEGGVPDELYVHDGLVDLDGYFEENRVDDQSFLEKFLLEVGQVSLTPGQHDSMNEDIRTNVHNGPGVKLKAMGLTVVPSYNPGRWNISSYVRHRNNCYNYATNILTNGFAQPGRASRCRNVGVVRRTAVLARADGLEAVPNANAVLATGHYVALALDLTGGDEDYHWWRKGSDGTWSHKPGEGRATNLDSSGNIINDPQTCDRGDYNVWKGYFKVVRDEVEIR